MADIAKIELVVKSSIGQLVTAEQVGDFWRCHVYIPKNVEARIKAFSKAFPDLIVDEHNGKNVIVRIPAQKHQRPNSNTPELWTEQRPQIAEPARDLRLILPDTPNFSTGEQLKRIAGLYEAVFGKPCEVQTLDEGRTKVTLLEDFAYPFTHPLLALAQPLMPALVPVAYASEHVGRKPKTSIFFAKPDPREPLPYQQVIIHIDGAFRDGVACYGVRYLMHGQPPAYLSGAMNCRDSNAAELIAFLQAVAHLDARVQNVAIFTDSTYLMAWLRNDGRDWHDRAIAKHGAVTVQHVKRDENKAAHTLANRLITRLFS